MEITLFSVVWVSVLIFGFYLHVIGARKNFVVLVLKDTKSLIVFLARFIVKLIACLCDFILEYIAQKNGVHRITVGEKLYKKERKHHI